MFQSGTSICTSTCKLPASKGTGVYRQGWNYTHIGHAPDLSKPLTFDVQIFARCMTIFHELFQMLAVPCIHFHGLAIDLYDKRTAFINFPCIAEYLAV
jgi:hypothetical protein